MWEVTKTAAPANYLVPTQREFFSKFEEGERNTQSQIDETQSLLDDQRGQITNKLLEMEPDLPIVDVLIDINGAATKKVSASRSHLQWEAALGSVALAGFIVGMVIVAGLVAVDFAYLFELFKGAFLNAYNELPADAVYLVVLMSLQAALSVLGYKLVLSSPRLLAWAGWVAAILVAIYGASLLLEKGFLELADATQAESQPLSWTLPTDAGPAVAIAPLRIFAIFGLGLPLMILPLVGGILSAWCLVLFKQGVESKVAWHQYRKSYDQLVSHRRQASALENKLAVLSAGKIDALLEPARIRVAEAEQQATLMLELVTRAKLAGQSSIAIPGGTTIQELDRAERLALEARSILDGQYLEREFRNWVQTKGPQWGGLS